jgi:selenocysteine-specific translation elongation factor
LTIEGVLVGVMGTDEEAKAALQSSLAKKSEAEGITVYQRTDSGKKISLLDDSAFPGKIQGYACIASLADYAFYLYPRTGKLAAPDGELAVLLESLSVPGRIMVLDGRGDPEIARNSLRGTAVSQYPVEERTLSSTALDLTGIELSSKGPGGTLVYVDRVFSVKGVGTVALGFVLRGTVSVHDQLRPIPGPAGLSADVKSIQVNDQDFQSSGRGIRVGLSLRGIEANDLSKSYWLDDGTTQLSDRLRINFKGSPFYKQDVVGRELHLQLPGEMLPASIETGESAEEITARLPVQVPVWDGMRVAVIDLNGKGLRVAGGGTCRS